MNNFGKQKLNQPKSFNLKGITNEQRSESSAKANVWKSTLYYGALSILILSTIGSIGLILETPEQKAARLKSQTEIQLAAEAQALELQKKTLDQEA